MVSYIQLYDMDERLFGVFQRLKAGFECFY
jgi:hypothetical protein